LLRAVPYHARNRRIYLPQSLLVEHAVPPQALFDLRPGRRLAPVARAVAAEAERLLDHSRRFVARPPRAFAAAFLPATLAWADLRRLQRVGYDLFDPSLTEPLPGRVWRLLWSRVRGRY
jgi:phytoene synthase